jgi:hypothetical protein
MIKQVLPMGLVRLAIVAWLSQWAVSTFGADFDEVIREPEKFDKKRVTILAMARVGGDRFYLYQSPEPKQLGDDPRVIYGSLSAEGPYYKMYDNKKVRVTGVVDVSYRGLADRNACSLTIERVRLADEVEKPKVTCDNQSCVEIKLSQLLKNTKNYEQKCVCVTGFAHVRGDAFVLYENEKATKDAHLARTRAIFVSHVSDTADYDRYNKRWIKIRGVVDLEQRGFTGYPAGIVAEEVRPASPTR